jgi:uncharacterized membrane protein YhhN
MLTFLWLFGIYTIPFGLLMVTLHVSTYEKYYRVAKFLSSAAFIGVALYASFVSGQSTHFMQLLPALLLCLLGDILLGFYHHTKDRKFFMAGLGTFLTGHIVFVLAFSQLQRLQMTDFILPTLALLLTVGLTGLKDMDTGRMKPLVYVYSFFVALLFSKAIHLMVFLPSLKTVILCIGSGLFMISDAIILFLYFYKKKHWAVHTANLATYYYGMFFIALSLMF